MSLRPVLIVEEGPDKGKNYSSDSVQIKVGRGKAAADFVLSGVDTSVSRVHFAVIRRGDTFVLTNLSANGTTVNGVKTPQALLNDNDLIKIGLLTVIRFRLEDIAAMEANPSYR
ncbi:MAG: FHA domain-containing protein [candidate division Zixibacteria bacterium]|nr:FHA domain-containing protein [candidate division Zixibacteria bacterium]